MKDVGEVKNIFEDYCKMYGQLIDFHKSTLLAYVDKHDIKVVGPRLMDKDEKYLKISLTLGTQKSISSDYLVLKIKFKIISWKSSILFW